MSTPRTYVCVFVILFNCAAAFAQDPAPAPNPARTTLGESLGTIEKHDLLRVSIAELAGPGVVSRKLIRVDDAGNVRVPMLGTLKLAGLNAAQAERAIAQGYRDKNLIAHAVIDVKRVEAGARVKAGAGPLASGDLVLVTVDDLAGPGQTSEFRAHVGEDGVVRLPYVGTVKLGGLAEGAAEDAVAQAFVKQSVVRTPVVSVRVLEAAATASVAPGPVTRGDVLSITLWDLVASGAPTAMSVRVDETGRAALPLVGPTELEGLSEAAAADAIVKRYVDANLIRNPVLSLYRATSADASGVKLEPIAKGDVLQVSVGELAGPGVATRKFVKVGDDGRVALPYVNVKVDGLHESDVPAAIAKAYRDGHLIQNAIVVALKVSPNQALPDDEPEQRKAPTPSAATDRAVPANAKRK